MKVTNFIPGNAESTESNNNQPTNNNQATNDNQPTQQAPEVISQISLKTKSDALFDFHKSCLTLTQTKVHHRFLSWKPT